RAEPGKKSVTIVHPLDAARLRAERVTAVPPPRPPPPAPPGLRAPGTLLAEAPAPPPRPPPPPPPATAGPASPWPSPQHAPGAGRVRFTRVNPARGVQGRTYCVYSSGTPLLYLSGVAGSISGNNSGERLKKKRAVSSRPFLTCFNITLRREAQHECSS